MTGKWQQDWRTQCVIRLKEDLSWYSYDSLVHVIAVSILLVVNVSVWILSPGAGSHFPREGATTICCNIPTYDFVEGIVLNTDDLFAFFNVIIVIYGFLLY